MANNYLQLDETPTETQDVEDFLGSSTTSRQYYSSSSSDELEELEDFRIDEDTERNPVHIQLDGELVFPAIAIKELRPVDFPSFQHFVESFFVRVQANSEDFESMGMVLLIKLLQAGQFRQARAAPRCPKIDQYHFAFKAGRGDGLLGSVVLYFKVR